jgi:ribosome-associated protein
VNLDSLPETIRRAIEAAQDKKAAAVTVLDLGGLGAFSDYFLICSAESARQIEAVGEAIDERLAQQGLHFRHREGRSGTEWLLLDYGKFIVHIFSVKARMFYDIERLWRSAKRLDVAEPGPGARGAESR